MEPPTIMRSIAGAVLTSIVASCATTPAELRRVHVAEFIECEFCEEPLHDLMDRAIADPGSEESAHALGHFVERWRSERGTANSGTVTTGVDPAFLAGGETTYQVKFTSGSPGMYLPAYFDQISPAEDFQVEKIAHHGRKGAGTPLMGLRENSGREAIERFYPPEAITRPVTAVLRPGRVRGEEQEIEIELLCPLRNESVLLGGRRQPLAADFSVSWGALLEQTGDLENAGFWGTLFRDNPVRDPRLFLMEPYDPHKKPLILIHGLLSTPLIWAELSNELWGDDEIRQRYQVWHYLYDTSAPALYSGRILRTQLRQLRPELDPAGDDPAMQATTIVAHSMGGIITRSLITRPENAFWDAAFTRPIEDLTLSDDDRAALREAFFWEPELHVKRVIYAAVPHLGSDFADNFIGRVGRWLLDPPNQFQAFYRRIDEANPGAFTEAYAELGHGRLDSVHALSPKQPTLEILSKLPNSHQVATHSIIGTRGRPGPIGQSSDGLVPYWSSHLEDADSELVIPSDHWVFRHPDGLAEIMRILRLDVD